MKEILLLNGTDNEIKVYPSSYIFGEYPKYEYAGNCIEIQPKALYTFLLDEERSKSIDSLIIQYNCEKDYYYHKNEWDPLAKYGIAVMLGTGKNILVTPTGVMGDAVASAIEIEDTYIVINGEWINKKADLHVKEKLLRNQGAVITKKLEDGSSTISGPFFIVQEKPDATEQTGRLVNTGTLIVERLPSVRGFKNFGTVQINSEDLFIKPAAKPATKPAPLP